MLTQDELLVSPAWFPLDLAARNAITMIRLDEAAYTAASFLDERILARDYPRTSCVTEVFRAAAAQLKPRSHYVFHTGHVGSTLISRLVGEHENLFVLREPALLRRLTRDFGKPEAPAVNLVDLLAILGRTWRPSSQRTVIKATSVVNELAEVILAGVDQPRAILVFTGPVNYLRGIFGGANSRLESKMLAPSRLQRLAARVSAEWRWETCSEGEQVAMSWLSEMFTLHQAALRFPAQVLWVEFDAFLREPLSGLRSIFDTFGVAVSNPQLAAIANGKLTRQYSKAPEYAYDAALRREVLQSANREHSYEIAKGMKWLENAAANNETVRTILDSALSGSMW